MPPITITITLEQILALPGEAAIYLIGQSNPSKILVAKARAMEAKGKARWVVLNGLRNLRPDHVGCAACDRADFQLGHAEDCPNSPADH